MQRRSVGAGHRLSVALSEGAESRAKFEGSRVRVNGGACAVSRTKTEGAFRAARGNGLRWPGPSLEVDIQLCGCIVNNRKEYFLICMRGDRPYVLKLENKDACNGNNHLLESPICS